MQSVAIVMGETEGAGMHEHMSVDTQAHMCAHTSSASHLTFMLERGMAAVNVWICSGLCVYWSQRSICF